MAKTYRNYLLLGLIVGFAFIYRALLMLRETYPSGADIGLHNSIIYSITQSGNIDFLYNFFHMGGGSSITFPGYHIFTSYVILLTGMPDYMAHAFVVSLFSSIIVLVAFLITCKVWNTSAALIVAFLVAVSRFDIEMLMWGGYPNVITLMLIPTTFYLFLEKNRLGKLPYLITASFICAAIFLTHSLSAALFIATTLATVFVIFIFGKRIGEKRINIIGWVAPLIFGAIIAAPFLLTVASSYLGAGASTFTGGITDISEALLSTKVLPAQIVVPLFVGVFLYFAFSKKYLGKALTVPAILLVTWWLIPTALTQSYLLNLYTDYERFLYFVVLPVIMLIGLGFYHISKFLADSFDWIISVAKDHPQFKINNHKSLRLMMPHLNHRNFTAIFVIVLVLFSFTSVRLFVAPDEGINVQKFYQLMNDSEFQAIQWAKANTPSNAIFVTDAQYGWWFSGFAQRPTISAVEPQYVSNARELQPATAARYLLDTNYLIDNGLIQLREDGGYVGRHNPELLIKYEDKYFPYPFFNLDNNLITILFRIEGAQDITQTYNLTSVPVTDMRIENGTLETGIEYATVYVTKQNELFNFTQTTTIYQGIRFANITESIVSNNPSITFDHVIFDIPTKGDFVPSIDKTTIGQFDIYGEAVGQIIFTKGQPDAKYQGLLRLDYDLNAQSYGEIAFSAGLYDYNVTKVKEIEEVSPANLYKYQQELLAINAENYMTPDSDARSLEIFDYHQAIAEYNISYIALRYTEHFPRFARDPKFDLVFINDAVAIFKVK